MYRNRAYSTGTSVQKTGLKYNLKKKKTVYSKSVQAYSTGTSVQKTGFKYN